MGGGGHEQMLCCRTEGHKAELDLEESAEGKNLVLISPCTSVLVYQDNTIVRSALSFYLPHVI